jgi:hypothetical protein
VIYYITMLSNCGDSLRIGPRPRGLQLISPTATGKQTPPVITRSLKKIAHSKSKSYCSANKREEKSRGVGFEPEQREFIMTEMREVIKEVKTVREGYMRMEVS